MTETLQLSVVIPVSERHDQIDDLVSQYVDGLQKTGLAYELVLVLDGAFEGVLERVERLQLGDTPVRIVQLARSFGEATALAAGIEHSRADLILTLPPYFQIEPARAADVVNRLLEIDADMVIARRWPRIDAKLNRIQARVFHSLFNFLTGSEFQDLGCGVRAFKKDIPEEIPLYGDQHRFFPVMAVRAGFRVSELALPQSAEDQSRRLYRSGVYVRRVIDIITMLFLLKFTRKPLRFYGLLGTATGAIGFLMLAYLISQRLFFGIALADRPALLLSSLLIVVAIQLFAIGLVGELMIFTHAKDLKEYKIAEVIEAGSPDSSPGEDGSASALWKQKANL